MIFRSMDYLRRRRRRKYHSPSTFDRLSSRDEDEIEQEIIERYVKKRKKTIWDGFDLFIVHWKSNERERKIFFDNLNILLTMSKFVTHR